MYRRDKVVNAIKTNYFNKYSTNLTVYGIKNKDLREFATTEKDVEKGITRIPLDLAKMQEDGILIEGPPA